MLNPLDPDLVLLSEIGKKFASPAVLCRWHLRGAKGARLESLKIAGRVYTTRAEFSRFIQQIQPRIATRPSSEREQTIDRELVAAGLA